MSQALKRIQKDLKELERNPLDGIAVSIPDESNLFELHANILIQDGPYEGMLLHAYIHLPQNYPACGPSMNLARGINFDHRFHEHVMNDTRYGNTICNDMLTNYASYFECIDNGQKKVATGWTPGCSLLTLLMQMTVFFSDSDLPVRLRPTEVQIAALKRELQSYCCSCGHSTCHPYPAIDLGSKKQSSSSETDQQPLSEEEKRLSYFRERLSCGITRTNVIDDAIILGYPVHVVQGRNGKLTFTAFVEPISYTCYQNARATRNMVTVMGHAYTHWVPCYLNASHLASRPQLAEECLDAIKNGGNIGSRQFDPLVALEVLSLLINQILIAIFNGSSHNSQTLIEGFCHLLQLLIYFMRRYPRITTQLQQEIRAFQSGRTSKKEVPDIGVFLMKVFLAKADYSSVKAALLEEYFARQVFWMHRDHGLDHNMKNVTGRLEKTFAASTVSNSLYVFLYSLFTKVFTAAVVSHMETNYGLPEQSLVDEIKAVIHKIRTELATYRQFGLATNTSDILSGPSTTFEVLNKAVLRSNKQGYTSLKIVA